VDRNEGSKRIVSAHRLQVSLPLPRSVRPTLQAAAFVTQLLEASTPSPHAAATTRESEATRRYRLTETSDQRRLPAGYRKSVSV
jgi:hypothetical protein